MGSIDAPSRQKSQRLINKISNIQQSQKNHQQKPKSKVISHLNELLPGLNDISDAFDAMPMELVKYLTLLKEIDGKSFKFVSKTNFLIDKYINDIYINSDTSENKEIEENVLASLKKNIVEVILCLDEKMHVSAFASDMMSKHMSRINNNYKLIISNNEIPESVRIGSLDHPALILNTNNESNGTLDKTTQTQRSESRREAMAAKKFSKDENIDDSGGVTNKKKNKDSLFTENSKNTNLSSLSTLIKKKAKKENVNIENGQKVSLDHKNNLMTVLDDLPDQYQSKKKKQKTNDNLNLDSLKSEVPLNNSLLSLDINLPSIQNDQKQLKLESYPESTSPTKNLSFSGSSNEPVYCYCNQISFGEMVGCDGDDCNKEWFHLACIGFKVPPKGKWYCLNCSLKQKKLKKLS